MGLEDKIKTLIRLTREKRVLPIPEPINAQQVLSDKVALVTGGDGGIGFAIAKAFVTAGAYVVIAGRDEKRLEACRQEIGGGVRRYALM